MGIGDLWDVVSWIGDLSALDWALILIWCAAVPQTLFLALYGFGGYHWWLSWIGRALFTSSLALALLLDLTLFEYYFPTDIATRPWVTNLILVVVAAGAALKLAAILYDKWPAFRRRFDRGGRA